MQILILVNIFKLQIIDANCIPLLYAAAFQLVKYAAGLQYALEVLQGFIVV